jgi:hypothetical protein
MNTIRTKFSGKMVHDLIDLPMELGHALVSEPQYRRRLDCLGQSRTLNLPTLIGAPFRE